MISAAKNDGISNKLRNDKPLFLVLESEHAVLDFLLKNLQIKMLYK